MVDFVSAMCSLDGKSADESFLFGQELYAKHYLNQSGSRGEMVSHDGMPVIFWADRYEHAFKTSTDRARFAYDKTKIDLERIKRIKWISLLISKSDPEIVCKEKSPPPNWKRAYFSYKLGYIVWLEQAKLIDNRPTAWKFSSAYNLPIPEIKRVTYGYQTR